MAALEPYARNAVISTSPDGGASSLAVDVCITGSELSSRATCSPTRILGPDPACPPPRTLRAARLARAPPPQSGARLRGAPAVRSRLARHLGGWREDGRGARPAPLTRSARHCRLSPLRTRRALRPERGPRRRLTTVRCCHRCRALRRLRRRGAMTAPQRRDTVSSSPVATPLRPLCPHQVARASEPSGSYSTRPHTPSRRHVALLLVERSQARLGDGTLRSLGAALMRWIGRTMTSPTANRQAKLHRRLRIATVSRQRRREFHSIPNHTGPARARSCYT